MNTSDVRINARMVRKMFFTTIIITSSLSS